MLATIKGLDRFALARISSMTMALMDGPCTTFDICTAGKILDHPFPWDCAIVDDVLDLSGCPRSKGL